MGEHELVVVWIRDGVPNEEESSKIEKIMGAPRLHNSRFFKKSESERIRNAKVINLTDNADINEFYADCLYDISGAKLGGESKSTKPMSNSKSGTFAEAVLTGVPLEDEPVEPEDYTTEESVTGKRRRGRPSANRD